MSLPFKRSKPGTVRAAIDPEGRRLLGLDIETKQPVFAPKGHSSTYAANGSGKTTSVAVPAVMSFACSEPHKAIAVLDSKDGELASQLAPMLERMGRKVAVIDDMGTRPELAHLRVHLNPFGAACATYQRDARDVRFSTQAIAETLVPEPAEGDAKNKYFRDVPRDIIGFALHASLSRNPEQATPGAVAGLLSDPDMLKYITEVEVEEGNPLLQSEARTLIEASAQDNWGQHISEARRALQLFAPGTRLHDVGTQKPKSHFELINQGYVIFIVGPQRFINLCASYYALHIQAFCDALYDQAGALRVIADEFTNTPLKSLVAALTTLRAYGGEIHMISQSRSEVVRKFGAKETQTIEDNSITMQWLSFSFDEASRVSKAMGEGHTVMRGISGSAAELKTQTNLSLAKQPHMTPAELMALPRNWILNHVKGLGFFFTERLTQANIWPYCDHYADNALEGARLPSDPKVTFVAPAGFIGGVA